MTIIFDSHVIKVTSTGIADYEWTTSGQSVDVGGYGGTTYYATVTLEDGYEIANVTSTDSNYNLLTFSGNVISFRTEYAGMGTGFTITTKAAAPKQTIDVSTLAGWANLATGNHQITIKTKASGYVDSAASNAVTVSKAESGETWVITNDMYISSTFTTNITFISDGTTYNSISFYKSGPLSTIKYDTYVAYHDGGWDSSNDALRTLKFLTSPTGDLLTWLQANAVKQ